MANDQLLPGEVETPIQGAPSGRAGLLPGETESPIGNTAPASAAPASPAGRGGWATQRNAQAQPGITPEMWAADPTNKKIMSGIRDTAEYAAPIAGEMIAGPRGAGAAYLGMKDLMEPKEVEQHPVRTAADTVGMVVAPTIAGKVLKWGEPLLNKVGISGEALADYLTRRPKTVGVAPAPASTVSVDSTADTIGHWAEPNPPAPGVNPQTTYSVPRADLEEMARRGDPGAAERLMEQGKRGLVIPRGAGEGYPGPRVEAAQEPPVSSTKPSTTPTTPPARSDWIKRAGGYGPKRLRKP